MREPARNVARLVLGATLLAGVLFASGRALAADAKDELLALEQARRAAVLARDFKTLANIYDESFRSVAANGTVIGRSTLFRAFQAGDARIHFDTSELDARRFGDAATMTGRLIGRNAAGVIVSDSRFIHVCVRRAGRWRIVAAQATPVPTP